MERKTLMTICLIVLYAGLIQASYKKEIYDAYVTKDRTKWKVVMDNMEASSSLTQAQHLELINYQYGYIGWCLGEDRDREAKTYIDKAETEAMSLIRKHYRVSRVNAYLAALYGFRISLSPLKAAALGPKSVEYAELAMSQDKLDPYGYLQYGNGLYYRPKLLGGSKLKALTYYLKAEQLMVATDIKEDWNYLNLLALIGMAYLETDQPKKAEQYFNKALTVEPRFTWVKEELIPRLRKVERK